MKPTIGVSPCSRLDDYLESVKRAGGEPFVLDPAEQPARNLDAIDALLLTGGLDVDPVLYGEAAHTTTEVDLARDAFEVPLTRDALARDMPLFAICRGVQVLNVAAGGSLIQDIPSTVTTDLTHSIDIPKDHIAHHVRVTPGSRLAASLGGEVPAETCAVNSRHHQAVGRIAPAFVASAVSEDGVVEAIERPGSIFCVGVQWHPENFWKSGEFQPLFSAFVNAAGAAARPRPARGAKESRKDTS